MEASYNNPRGPVHIVTGAGGAPAFDTFGPANDFTRKRLKDWSYGKVTVSNSTHFTYNHVFNSNGSLFDTWTVVQENHGPFNATI